MIREKFVVVEEALADWIESNGLELATVVHWDEEPRNRIPAVITAASPQMMRTYKRFGEIVCITVMPHATNTLTFDGNSFELVLFSVPDTNERPLLVGFGLFAEKSVSALSRICKDFFIIHGQTPSALLTNDRKLFRDEIRSLQESRVFTGVHILNRYQVLNSRIKEIDAPYLELVDILKRLRIATSTRSPSSLRNIQKSLAEDPLTNTLASQLFS